MAIRQTVGDVVIFTFEPGQLDEIARGMMVTIPDGRCGEVMYLRTTRELGRTAFVRPWDQYDPYEFRLVDLQPWIDPQGVIG